MLNVRWIVLLGALLAGPVFADDVTSPNTKPCETIAKACLDAGYTRTDTADKQFWPNCMRPIVLGKTVSDVNVDKTTVKACRTDKIAELKKELKDFQNAS